MKRKTAATFRVQIPLLVQSVPGECSSMAESVVVSHLTGVRFSALPNLFFYTEAVV